LLWFIYANQCDLSKRHYRENGIGIKGQVGIDPLTQNLCVRLVDIQVSGPRIHRKRSLCSKPVPRLRKRQQRWSVGTGGVAIHQYGLERPLEDVCSKQPCHPNSRERISICSLAGALRRTLELWTIPTPRWYPYYESAFIVEYPTTQLMSNGSRLDPGIHVFGQSELAT